MIRLVAVGVLSALALTACSPDPLGEYIESINEITVKMRRDSVTALPDPSDPTRERVAGVVSARRSAVDALEGIVAPSEFRPEHAALRLALSELTAAGEAILSETAVLDSEAFTAAISSATTLDALAQRVAAACDALEARAVQLGYSSDLVC